ncbi:hypothetical protein NBT05_06915 [Aquimarina sp. ERC-38]|uniref:hypothetical protein n=1 Tax=Aquimarina sp. ERC-38 TaxID=2949996 RepID=UPI0022486112|nr:hypothetical protein [Aquimarina sp. ERC-38]UZO82199.1 hypothetical protein NBT05_06915 [Aquimarina sp. ERC-38]
MFEIKEYLMAVAICSPLLFFILAVTFRLLDNSASIFLDHDILLDSAYVSNSLIKKQIEDSNDEKLKKRLKNSLRYRKLHYIFMILAIATLPIVVVIAVLFII